MCPLYPLHLVFTYGTLLLCLWFCIGSTIANKINVELSVNQSVVDKYLSLNEEQTKTVTYDLQGLPLDAVGTILIQEDSDDHLSHIKITPAEISLEDKQEFNITGEFLGTSRLRFVLSSGNNDVELMQNQTIPIKVHRETTTLDIVFIHAVILLVVFAFINMGCAINMDIIKENLRRPVAPAIGLCSQYLFMPLVSYALGYLLFSSNSAFWLGLFLSGCAPGGGGSNMWTYLLGGSLDLSVTMTFLSTILAFATLPLWVYALAPTIFAEGHYGNLPYRNIAALVLGLVVPLGIGVGIRRCCPKAADFLKKMLKPLSLVFIIFILTFGVYAKFYLFYFFSWQVVLAGFLLPFLGFVFGFAMAKFMGRKPEEIIAIAIETGVQNTGLSIAVLKVALEEYAPLGDISIVMPVAVATMTPLPLFIALIIKKVRDRKLKKKDLGIPKSNSGAVVLIVDKNENNKKSEFSSTEFH